MTPSATTPPTADATFAASWPAIQSALDRRDLKTAHQLLSKWHGNETLSPTDTQKVETLLSQLAGTVIYSSDFQLEPARVVKPGETLDSIAKEYNVPWQLLAKINGIPALEQLRPGQSLKVVRGPFSAVLNVRHNEVTLMVDDRYAGKFHVEVPPGVTVPDGQWVVDQKLGGSPATPSAYATKPLAGERTIILRNAAASGAGSAMLLLSSSTGAPASGPPSLHVSAQDAEELSDILSIGSRVVVRK